ncbi:TonB-dependent receptor [Paraglaciecola aquimarina]|uniref:TonB-dependent receptor n=1 Tax=Paraglaciecola aquimarina TaxID=1235557 RepID=A0ABU3T0R3_9ALTE|nr:TonB-dependent receptor [Paraglaciecola aquimarina]MDU0355855.1 TonB-dependent receptor [Paraglaciecola aquimarina]
MNVNKLVFQATKLKTLAMIIPSLIATGAYAQTTEQATKQVIEQGNEESKIEQIVVTAQQHAQPITEVPLALTAFGATDLEKMNLTDLERIASLTPGLIVQQQTDSSPSFVIRGVEAANAGAAAEPTISIFYNGIDSSRSRSSVKELYDIERIEIAKGPQGTLFGRGASTGAIAIHTKKADTEGNEGFVEARLGNYNLQSVTGAYNFAVNEEFGIRIAGSRRTRDGYVDNLTPDEDKFNDDDMLAARVSLKWIPRDDVNVDFIFDHQNDSDGEAVTKSIVVASPGGNTSAFTASGQNPSPVEQSRRQTGYTLLVDWDINENWSLSSLTGYRQLWSQNGFDIDGTTYDAFSALPHDNQKMASQELRFSYTGDATTVIFGGSYYNDKSVSGTDFVVNEQYLLAGFPKNLTPLTELPISEDVSVPLNTGNVSSSVTDNDRDSFSIFSNVNVTLSDRLILDAGLRYTWDKAKIRLNGFAIHLRWHAIIRVSERFIWWQLFWRANNNKRRL